ncbi:hypothetical protein ABZ479_09645 [Streptomyces sp. NPDC005722]
MIAWSKALVDLGYGMVLMSVALNVGSTAERLHRRVAIRPKLNAWVTPLVLRVTSAVVGALGLTVGAVRLVHAYAG